MATAYHPFGPCYVQIKFDAGWATLGLTKEGGSVTIETVRSPIMSDAAGPDVPAEFQRIGEKAKVRFELATWDETVRAALMARVASAGDKAEGVGGVPGMLIGTGGASFGLWLPSALDLPWYFPTCNLANQDAVYGTKANPAKYDVEAWRFVPGSVVTAEDIVLYTRDDPI